MRAFEIAPGHAAAAERLAEALLTRGRAGAADEIRREHATALGAAGRAVHVRRMRQAVKDTDDILVSSGKVAKRGQKIEAMEFGNADGGRGGEDPPALAGEKGGRLRLRVIEEA